MNDAPSFPPLVSGQRATDPPGAARRLAAAGCDGGTLLYDFAHGDLTAALILAPDVPLARAAEMLPVAGLGLHDALAVLAPPELAIRLDWDGGLRVNGAKAGRLGCHASQRDPGARPDWLIVTLRVDFLPPSEDMGTMPERTALYAEGCGEITPPALLDSWCRHTLLWINRWMDGERPLLHRVYSGLLHGLDAPVTLAGTRGTLTGIDSDFSAILQSDGDRITIPVHALVQP